MRNSCFYILLFIVVCAGSCRDDDHPADKPVIVMTPEQMNEVVSKNIRDVIAFAEKNQGRMNECLALWSTPLVSNYYKSNNYQNVWSDSEVPHPMVDSLLRFINQSRYYGLFPADYHSFALSALYDSLESDSAARKNAMLWTQFDLLSTDAFFKILRDIKEGRMVPDSMSIVNKAPWPDSFFVQKLNVVLGQKNLVSVIDSAEPGNIHYRLIRDHLRDFVDNMDSSNYPHVPFPYQDTLKFRKTIYARMLQEGIGTTAVKIPDSLQLSASLKQYQKKHGLEVDGKPGPATVGSMNNNDKNKFLQVAITLDEYKTMDPLPETYVWVNIPSYRLQLWDHDTIVLTSKTIVGKPQTPTPELTSRINNLVIYPNWTIPASIIKKDILPQLKKDPGYLARKGYNLFTDSGKIVDPFTINWAKYKTGIPYRVVQGSGDDNALGVFKFNFSNPFSVYLHDTNQRYLFSNKDRALSHGCVRVQRWQQLADFIADRDSILQKSGPLSYSKDSIRSWVNRQVRKSIMVKNRLPLYIVYVTCGTDKDNNLEFYSDIYGTDQELADKYFKGK